MLCGQKLALMSRRSQLAERKQIVEKEYGKQKVYYAVQNASEVPSEEAMQELDERIEVRQ